MELLCMLLVFFTAITTSVSLKCRNKETIGQPQDMEWAVRQCFRQFSQNVTGLHGRRPDGRTQVQQFGQNSSDYDHNISSIIANLQGWSRNHQDMDNRRTRADMPMRGGHQQEPSDDRPSYRGQFQRPGQSREVSRPPSRKQHQYDNEDGYDNEEPYYPPSRDDPRQRQRNWNNNRDRNGPHTSTQQHSYDRDNGDYNRKPLFKPTNGFVTNGSNQETSGIASMDPCLIYCIFQELKMLDDQGRLTKENVLNEMTKHLQEREMRDFVRYSVEDCFLDISDDGPEGPSPYREKDQPHSMGMYRPHPSQDRTDKCRTSKTLAICLEERGKQGCDDWNDSMKNENNSNNNKNSNQSEGSNRESTNDSKPNGGKKGIKIPTRG